MQRHHAVETVLQDALARAAPREFHIALVAEHGYAVRATPGSRSRKIVERARRVARRIHPQHECACGVRRADGRQVEPAGGVHRHGDAAATRERGAHFVGRIRHGRIQHGVAVGAAQLHVLRCGGDELFAAHARRHLRERHVDAEAPLHPRAGGGAQRFGADARRVSAFGVRRRQRGDHRGSRCVARRADRQVDDAAVVLGGQLGERVEPVVGVRRWNERLRGHAGATTNSVRRPRDASASLARTRMPPSSCVVDTTSPSRCNDAITSPRS